MRNKRHLNRTHEELSSTALAEHCSAVSPAILCPVGLCVRGGAGRRAGDRAHVAQGHRVPHHRPPTPVASM